MADNLRRLIFEETLSPTSRESLTNWMLGCKTGNNGKDGFSDIAVAWSNRGEPVVICAYTRGGAPTPRQVDDVFAGIGRYVGVHLVAAA